MERICPACGASSGKKPFVGEHCADCWLSRERGRWPASVELTVCVKCGRVWREKKWKYPAPTLTASLVEAAFEKHGLEGHYNVEAGVFEGILHEGGGRVPFSQTVEVIRKKTQCPTCSRSESNYHEAIIQLRGNRDLVERAARRLVRRLEKKTFLARMEEMHGGLDLYVGFKKEVAGLLQEEELKFVRSEKLAGQKQGKRLYRSTFLIRLEKEGEGDREPG